MTDKIFDLTQQGGVGRQPVTNAGRVGYNFRLDQDALESRKRKGAVGSLWPTASMEDKVFFVLPRDICLAEKKRPTRKQTDGMMTVWSVLNGIRADSLRQLIESHTFAGIAGGQGAVFDTIGNNPRWPEFAGIVGGLYTIINNGPDRIMNGQLVYWDIPASWAVFDKELGLRDPKRVTELGRRDSYRITATTRPYKPSSQGATATALRDAIRSSFSSSATSDYDTAGSVTDQAAMRLKWAALQISVNAVEAMLSSGLVKFDPEAVGDEGARRENARAWGALRKTTRENYITKIACGIGCRRTQGTGNDLFRMKDAKGEDMTVKKHICDLLTFDSMLVGYTDGTTIPSGNKGEVVRNQESTIKDLLSGIAQANHYVGDRIFCKALSPAAPGKEFDAIFGHYRQ